MSAGFPCCCCTPGCTRTIIGPVTRRRRSTARACARWTGCCLPWSTSWPIGRSRRGSLPGARETEETRRRLVEPVPLAELLDGTPLRLGISWRVDDAEPGTIVVSQVVPESLAAGGLADRRPHLRDWRPAVRRRRYLPPLGQEPARAHRVADRTGRAASGVDVAARGRGAAREARRKHGGNMVGTRDTDADRPLAVAVRRRRCGWPTSARPSGRRAAA